MCVEPGFIQELNLDIAMPNSQQKPSNFPIPSFPAWTQGRGKHAHSACCTGSYMIQLETLRSRVPAKHLPLDAEPWTGFGRESQSQSKLFSQDSQLQEFAVFYRHRAKVFKAWWKTHFFPSYSRIKEQSCFKYLLCCKLLLAALEDEIIRITSFMITKE